MVVCSYFLRGQCRFGASCLNEHPNSGQSASDRPANGGNNASKAVATPFTTESIQRDLTAGLDKPLWPFSAYGPAKYEPTLITGQEESPEEFRVKCWLASSSNNLSQYLTYEKTQGNSADSNFQSAISNIQSVFKAAYDASPVTPNPPTSSNQSAFGANTTATSAFGSTPDPPSAFLTGGSAFGQPRTSAFGTPSNTAHSAFGTSTVATGSGFSAFASPNRPSAFGTPQPANQTALTPSVFAQPQQPSAFGQPQTGPSAFGRPSAFTTVPSAFGQPSVFAQHGQQSVFGTSQQPSAFGQPQPTAQSAFGHLQAASPAFGAPQQTHSAFGKPQPAAQSAFGVSQPAIQSTFSNQQQTPTSSFGTAPTPPAPKTDPSDAILPPNYIQLLPEDVKNAFAASEFEWGKIPDWIPPVEMR